MSPSTVGLVATITSVTFSSSMRATRSRIRNCSGPIPSIGEIDPPST